MTRLAVYWLGGVSRRCSCVIAHFYQHFICGDALRLGVKAGWRTPFVDKRVGGRKNSMILLTRDILSSFQMSIHN